MATREPQHGVTSEPTGSIRPPHLPEPPEDRRDDGRSLTAHLSDLTHETVDLFRHEIALGKAEMAENIDQAKRGAAALVTGGAILTGGVMVLLATAVLVLGLFWPLWVAALVVGGATVVIGASLVAKGKRDLEPRRLAPRRALRELERTKDMAKEHV